MQIDESHLSQIEGMILSMTPGERRDPGLINGSRRRRIAAGSGRTVQDVNRLLAQFEQMKKMMRGLTSGGGIPTMAGMPGRHSGSSKNSSQKNKRKPPSSFKLPFGRN